MVKFNYLNIKQIKSIHPIQNYTLTCIESKEDLYSVSSNAHRTKEAFVLPVFHTIFQTLDQPMVVVRIIRDTAFILEANRAFCRLVGYSNEEIIGKAANDIISQYCLKQDKLQFQKETFLYTKRRRRTPVRIEHKPLDKAACGQDNLAIILVEDLSAHKWIAEQYERDKVLISGIVDSNYHIRYLKDFFAPLLFEPEKRLEDETILEFISETEFKRFEEAFLTSSKMKKMNHLKVKTKKLSGVELELTVTFTPLFDGFGTIKEYAFVIWDLNPINDSVDSSMKLKIWMAKRDMSANQLAAATHISIQTISKLRNGKIKKPQRLTAELIASELKVEVSEIWSEVRRGR
ncbi:MAG: PAS domain S-box protein [Candidatus Pristimantibacillus sp.]